MLTEKRFVLEIVRNDIVIADGQAHCGMDAEMAVDQLNAQADAIRDLTEALEKLLTQYHTSDDRNYNTDDAIISRVNEHDLTIGDLRKARAALQRAKGKTT